MNRSRAARERSYHIKRDPFTRERVEFSRPAHDDPKPRSGARRLRSFLARLALASLVAGPMTAVAARERVVAMAPFAAPAFAAIGLPVNTRGLAIEDVSARLAEAGEKKVLVVEGWIVNLRPARTASPDLRIALRGPDGRELYVWTTRAPASGLQRAERVRFTARLEAPPEGAEEAMVNFVASGARPAREAEGS